MKSHIAQTSNMNVKQLLVNFGKLILCGLAYFVGLILGGMVASFFNLSQPPMPEGGDQATLAIAMLLVSPILALALVLIARNIAGGWLVRTLILSVLTYVAYTLNTVLDASLYVTAYASTSAFTIISAIVPSLFCGGAVALLFASIEKGESFFTAWKAYFSQRTPGQWLWRLLLAVVAFMPIYIFFGLLINPITGEYYRQNMYGLQAATWGQILPVQFLRSLLFMLACLPIFIAWQKSMRSLLLSLGVTLFILVGFVYLLIGSWLPLSVRIPHMIEILADSFVYAGALTWLLARRFPFLEKKHLASQNQEL